METLSALLALWAGNSPATGEFPTQKPVTRTFDVFFDLRPDKRLSKQPWGWWIETPSWSLWRHCNVEYYKYRLFCIFKCIPLLQIMLYPQGCFRKHYDDVIKWKTFSVLLVLCARNSPITGEFPWQRPVTRSFDVFFDLRLNKRLCKQSRRRGFETPWRSSWHHCNDCFGWLFWKRLSPSKFYKLRKAIALPLTPRRVEIFERHVHTLKIRVTMMPTLSPVVVMTSSDTNNHKFHIMITHSFQW